MEVTPAAAPATAATTAAPVPRDFRVTSFLSICLSTV
jgi:hypothetical protein